MSIEIREQRNIARPVISFIVGIMLVISLAVFLVYGFALNTTNNGQSMAPTIEDGEVILIDRFSYHFNDPERYDLIAFNAVFKDSATDEPEVLVRRIVGLPGERIKIENGHIYINGEMLSDDSGWNNVSLAGLAADEITLEEDEYFVLGDNRRSSEDSRFDNLGNVEYGDIIGRAWYRSSPFKKIGRIY